jgi:D-alanine-D-alanine ligase
MAKKLRVGILFGGRSSEHEVSLLSAASIMKAIDRRKFDVVPIGITKEGRWLGAGDSSLLLEQGDAVLQHKLRAAGEEQAPAASAVISPEPAKVVVAKQGFSGQTGLDVVLPVLHGTFGEDGTIQGLFELAGIAYVGSGVLGSSAGMDKDVMKRLFAQAKLPIVKHLTVLRSEWEKSPRKVITLIEKKLRYPVFVKPANAGSSVGISKVHDRKELQPALALAAQYDRKLLIEQGVGGKKGRAREFEVAVLGNDDPQASVIGEIIPSKEFYDYEAKYLSEGSVPVIPANITRAEEKQIRAMAVEAFRACDLAGLARVDFLMEPGGKRRIYLNEVNTLPGFTQISMYPKLWEATGINYRDLITRLIELAIERNQDRTRNAYSRMEQ